MSRKQTKVGRKTILDARLTERLCALLADANTIKTACDACGISDRAFHNWMERGEQEGRGEFFHFVQSVTRARAKAKQRLVKVLVDASAVDWRSAAWLLSHCWPSEFSETTRSEVAVAAGVALVPMKMPGAE